MQKAQRTGRSEGEVFHFYAAYNICVVHTECPGRNVPDFGRMFLTLKYTDLTQNTCIQS